MTTAQRWWERRFEQFIITNRNTPLHSKWKIQKQSVQHFQPACLQAFLISNDLKRVGKWHTITQAVRPRSVIAPIVVGLWSELEQVFGSKWFLDQHTLGFSISYDEVSCSNTPCCTNESLLLITELSAYNSFRFQQPSMNPAHFTGWVSCADQGPNLISKKRKRGFDGGPGLWSLISLIQTGILLIDFLIRTHSKECCKYQHGCYRELSHRHRIWRIGLVICRMFSFWRTTLHLLIISISYHLSTWTPEIVVASSQWSVSWITRSAARSCLERLSSRCSWRQLKLSARKMFHTLMSAVGGSFRLIGGLGVEEALWQAYGPNALMHMLSGKAISRAVTCYTSTGHGISWWNLFYLWG